MKRLVFLFPFPLSLVRGWGLFHGETPISTEQLSPEMITILPQMMANSQDILQDIPTVNVPEPILETEILQEDTDHTKLPYLNPIGAGGFQWEKESREFLRKYHHRNSEKPKPPSWDDIENLKENNASITIEEIEPQDDLKGLAVAQEARGQEAIDESLIKPAPDISLIKNNIRRVQLPPLAANGDYGKVPAPVAFDVNEIDEDNDPQPIDPSFEVTTQESSENGYPLGAATAAAAGGLILTSGSCCLLAAGRRRRRRRRHQQQQQLPLISPSSSPTTSSGVRVRGLGRFSQMKLAAA